MKGGGKVSNNFKVKDGLGQGDLLSIILFNFELRKLYSIIRDTVPSLLEGKNEMMETMECMGK